MDKSERRLPDSVDWDPETERWFEEWRDSSLTDGWTPQQWSYLYDTALVHAEVWGDMNTAMLGELHKREAYMGVVFNAKKQNSTDRKPNADGRENVIEVIMANRAKRSGAAG